MSRSERWNTVNEIKRKLHETTDPNNSAGPVVYVENGRKYSDDGESHIAAIGCTGKGKSQCCSLPFMREILQKGESLIMLDPKGEGYMKNACYIPKNYQIFCVDFRSPRHSPTKWNPLSSPFRLFRSEDPDDNDIASSMLSELWNGVYPYDGHSDKFWTDSSVNYAKGLTYGLFETASKDQINLDSVAIMMEQSEVRMGPVNLLKAFYDSLPSDSLAKRNLATYVTAPNETRASIHSVAASGLEVFSRSKGLMEMLSNDTLNIMDIDVDRPFALIIIVPDETDVYSPIAAILISQFVQHLIRVAQERGGRLPIRVNVILEELGSVGRAISQLPNMLVAARSRNIRVMMILQSGTSQLIDIYGKSRAEIINSCIGITIGFSTNCWETLNEWAQRCGERQKDNNGHIIKEPLITAAQLAAMPTGTALVIIDNQYKFISHFPFYDEMYDNSDWKAPQKYPAARCSRIKQFDFEALVNAIREKKIESIFSNASTGKKASETPTGAPNDRSHVDSTLDVSSLISRIDAKIAELEAEEETERKKQESQNKYHVIITEIQENKENIAQVIVASKGGSMEKAIEMLSHIPVDITFSSRIEATKFVREVSKAGGKAKIRTF